MEKPKPSKEARKWLRERADTGDDYVDPVRQGLEMFTSIKSKLTDEEWEWAELDKKMEKILNPTEWTDIKKKREVQHLYIYVDYLWMTESEGYTKNRAYEELSNKYTLDESTIKLIVK